MTDVIELKRKKIYKKLVKEGYDPSFNRLTAKMIKRIFELIDEEFYGYYIKDTLNSKKRILKCGTYYDEEKGHINSKYYIDGKTHFIDVNSNIFVEVEFKPPLMLRKLNVEIDKLQTLQYLLENESLALAMDLKMDVESDKDRKYDLYGEERRDMCDAIFGNTHFYGVHRKIDTRRDLIWFEHKGKIKEGKLKEYVKDEPKTIVVGKDGKEYTVDNYYVYSKERDEYWVE